MSEYVAFVDPYTASLPRDYTFAESEHTFSPTISRVCRDISIEDDTVVEDTEFFTVSLESINNAVVNGSASVQITDDDGELIIQQYTFIVATSKYDRGHCQNL